MRLLPLPLLCVLCLCQSAWATDGLVAPYVAAHSYYLLEVESNQPLAALNSDERVEPASITKLMTLYLTFHALRNKTLSPRQTILVSVHAWKAEGSRMFIEPTKPVTVDELIHGVIVDSGNDASIALAEAQGGTEAHFVQLMNKTATELGMSNTHFVNATGLPDPQHYSTAHDLALLADAIIHEFPEYYPLFSIKEYQYNGITQSNRNRLLWIDTAVDGMKTGHTESAGYCLIGSAKRGDRRLLAVVLGTGSDEARSTETLKLLNWGFQAFESRELFRKGAAIKSLDVYKGATREVRTGFNEDIWVTYPAGESTRSKQLLTTLQPVIAPVNAGQKLGKLDILYDGKTVGTYHLEALDTVTVGNAFTRFWDGARLMLK